VLDICKITFEREFMELPLTLTYSYALAADIQTIPGLPTAPGYLNVDIDTETGDIDGMF
jgi:formyltetrahydrofolate synthetase